MSAWRDRETFGRQKGPEIKSRVARKYLACCPSFSGLRIVNSQITSSKSNQFLNQSYAFSEKISPWGLALRTFLIGI
jgi:hypothetical protein